MQLRVEQIGFLLISLGTLLAYIVFAAVRMDNYGAPGPVPVVTDMFREWPLAGSATAGIGSSLMVYGLQKNHPQDANLWLLVASCWLWLVIGSSITYGNSVMGTFHDVFTFFFLLSSIMALYKMDQKPFTRAQVAAFVFAISACINSLLLYIDKERFIKARIALAMSELLFLVSVGYGFGGHLFFFSPTPLLQQQQQNQSKMVQVFKIY